MRLAIMQPYIFPYIGYYQLMYTADKFVVYDDVNFIKQGWINRNKILLNGKDFVFTVPLANASSFIHINETERNQNLYQGWKVKFLKTAEQAYAKAPNFTQVFELVSEVFNKPCKTISDLCVASLLATNEYLGINTPVVTTSTGYDNNQLKAKERVIDICRQEHATEYVNPIGGMELYSKDVFAEVELQLYFIKSKAIHYRQFKNEFVPWLSIIDIMMFNPVSEITGFLNEFELI